MHLHPTTAPSWQGWAQLVQRPSAHRSRAAVRWSDLLHRALLCLLRGGGPRWSRTVSACTRAEHDGTRRGMSDDDGREDAEADSATVRRGHRVEDRLAALLEAPPDRLSGRAASGPRRLRPGGRPATRPAAGPDRSRAGLCAACVLAELSTEPTPVAVRAPKVEVAGSAQALLAPLGRRCPLAVDHHALPPVAHRSVLPHMPGRPRAGTRLNRYRVHPLPSERDGRAAPHLYGWPSWRAASARAPRPRREDVEAACAAGALRSPWATDVAVSATHATPCADRRPR
ncbi:MAG: hypothetical protein JWM64_60 [Frankiales bacterium]|nr:hypothetical protein [Frankiales bacterium]